MCRESRLARLIREWRGAKKAGSIKHRLKVIFFGRNKRWHHSLRDSVCPFCLDADKARHVSEAPGFALAKCDRCNESFLY